MSVKSSGETFEGASAGERAHASSEDTSCCPTVGSINRAAPSDTLNNSGLYSSDALLLLSSSPCSSSPSSEKVCSEAEVAVILQSNTAELTPSRNFGSSAKRKALECIPRRVSMWFETPFVGFIVEKLVFIFFLTIGGVFAATGAVHAKSAFDFSAKTSALYRSFPIYGLSGWVREYFVRLIFLCLMLTFNAFMVKFNFRALTRASAVAVSMLQFASNTVTSGILGRILFKEHLGVKWLVGVSCIVTGVLLIGQGEKTSSSSASSTGSKNYVDTTTTTKSSSSSSS